MKNFLNKIKDDFLNDIKFNSKEFNKILIEMGILLLGMFICAFVDFFVYCELALFAVFILLNYKSAKIIYFCVLLLPYFMLLKSIHNMHDLPQYLMCIVMIVLLVRFFIEIIKNKKNINWKITISFAILLIYLVQPWNFVNLIHNIEYAICLVLLYLAFIYRKEINIKELTLVLSMSLLFSCLIGCFQPLSERMNTLLPYMYTESGDRRFHGTTATNILASELIFCISLLLALHLNQKNKIVSVLFITIFLNFLFATYSKLGLLVFLLIFAIYVIMYLCKNKKPCYHFYLLCGCVVITMLVNFNKCLLIIERLFVVFAVVQPEIGVKISSALLVVTSSLVALKYSTTLIAGGSIFNNITTGRMAIWIHYIKDLFSSFKVFLLGHGAYSGNLVWEAYPDGGMSPHNTYLLYLNKYGFLLVILIAILIYAFLSSHKFKLNFASGTLPVVAFLMCMVSEDFIYIEMFTMLLISCFFLFNEKEDVFIDKQISQKKDEDSLKIKETVIPKIIHYIWVGGKPLPEIANKCIESWKKYCPDYEIKRWDESNLDLNYCDYVKQAYENKKYAFVSDVLRTQILYEHGGVYLDIDVELLGSIDKFLNNDCFYGFESEKLIAPGLIMGSVKGNKDLKNILDIYKNKQFIVDGKQDLTTICEIFTNYYKEKGLVPNNTTQLVENTMFYATEYFCPRTYESKKVNKTENTVAIHHYFASWVPKKNKLKAKVAHVIKSVFGEKFLNKILEIKNKKRDNK